MEWVRRFTRREEPRRKGLSPEELADALTRWREGNAYAWWLNDNLDAVSSAVQRQVALVRETKVALAVQRKRDVPREEKSRLVEGLDELLEVIDGVMADPPEGRELWPGHSPERFRGSVDALAEGARQAKSDLISGRIAPAHEGFKAAVEDWLFASVRIRYSLNAYMKETLPAEVLAALPPAMLPAEAPRELARYARSGNI